MCVFEGLFRIFERRFNIKQQKENEPMEENEEIFKTDDLFIASGLRYLGLPLIKIEPEFKRVYFVFKGGSEAQEKLKDYLNDEGGARSILTMYRDLKNLIFTKQQ